MERFFQAALKTIGDRSVIKDWRRVRGGDINDAYYVRSEENEYFIKLQDQAPPRFFEMEAEGLNELRKANAIHVPKVYGFYDREDLSFLLMEWVEGRVAKDTGELLGHGVAQLHQYTNDRFGYGHDNYIGKIVQKQIWSSSWIDYYRDIRLLWQIQLAEQRNLLPLSLRKKLDQLLNQLDKWLPKQCKPSLLHGDLWGGNWITGPKGTPYLIDPSVLYGHHEFEIAFTELFGGFPASFYYAYEEILPLSPEYQERKPLYQLYYLLVHLNLFGTTYLKSIERIVRYYTG